MNLKSAEQHDNAHRHDGRLERVPWSFAFWTILLLPIAGAWAQMPAGSPKSVPSNAVMPSMMDLRIPPRSLSKTADDIFAVRNDCVAPHDSVLIDDYAKATLTSQPILVSNCRRFGGNEISAIGTDAKYIYVKFGYDEEDGGPIPSENTNNILVLDRKTHAELGVSRFGDWLDLLDASGQDLVGCNCLGTFADKPFDTCLVAAKTASKIRFRASQMRAAIACLRGSNAIKAARIFVDENERWVVGGAAVNEKYIVLNYPPYAVYTVQSPTRKLDLSLLPPGYTIEGLGRGHTADLAVLSIKNDQTVTVAIETIPAGKLTEMTALPLPIGSYETPAIHLYSDWLVAASGDTLFIHHMSAPHNSFVYRTDDGVSIHAADLYGHLVFVQLRRVISDRQSAEPPSLQIDLDSLAKQ